MSERNEQLDRARQVIADLRRKLADAQAAASGAVAVVGMACRFPGEARDCDGYWRMIEAGRDAVRPIPAHRARDMAPGSLRPTALLDDIETFDAAFFDISPREARQMDPQQRIFLEVAWDALEDAGQTKARLAGGSVGIFVGVHNHSSGYLELQNAEAERLNEYTALGSGHDVIAGRLGYFLDSRGLSAVINTACSSSLVAVHLACQALLSRDCRMAVTGGVNLILGPAHSRLVGLASMLAPDGRCKTFDARADGYGRGEGCGVVVLKRLADAIADRDRVLAVIRGSAVNQDGRSNGLTAPNGLAQQALMRRALARAGLSASRVGYVEAHGTGTALGDPIEVDSLAAVYGAPGDGATSCALGSAKANISHLEGAAGVAGLIRAVLALRARIIPPVAGFERQNPHLSLQGTRLTIPTQASAWQSETPRVAAVSAFGWSGANAHVLLEEAPVEPPSTPARPTVLMVSAVDAPSLPGRAVMLAEALDRLPDDALESFAWTATDRRTRFDCRLAVAGASRAELAAALRRKASGEGQTPRGSSPALGFLIGDDSSAAAAFASELMAEEDCYRTAAARCAAAFESAGHPAFAASLMSGGDDGAAALRRARLLAHGIGLAALLARWGVTPAAVAGWGDGSAAAAHLAGEIGLAEAVRRVPSETGASGPGMAHERLLRAKVDRIVRLDTMTASDCEAAPNGSARLRLMRVLADLAESGADLAWSEVYSPSARLVSLPAHSFRRRRYWIAEPPPGPAVSVPPAPVPDEWMFETGWREAASPGGAAPDRFTDWLILGGADGCADRLAAIVRRTGRALVERASEPGLVRLAEITGWGRWAVVDLRALDARSGAIPADALRLASQVADLHGALSKAPDACDAKLWLVTRGAQSVLAGETPDLAAAPLLGLSRSLGLDHPERWGGLIDLDPASRLDPARLHDEIAGGGEEFEIAIRGEARYLRRVARMAATDPGTMRLNPAATYLVTGAFGAIGSPLALWLAGRGARSLVLAGRSLVAASGADHPASALRRQLEELGADARLERCDVGDPDAVADLFERIRGAGTPLRGVFHAAAAATGAVEDVRRSDLAAAFRPKIDGALALHEHSRAFALDHFVLFSSAAGTLGARGRGHYAGANAFLDALAARRRAEGLPALSIAWGLWGGRDEEGPEMRFFRSVGFNPMPPETALDAMAQVMSAHARGRPDAQPLVASLDGDRLRSAFELRGRAGLVSGLAPQDGVRQTAESRALVETLRAAPVGLRRRMLFDAIALEVRKVLELEPDDALDLERGFFDLGMDSLITVALKARLEDLFAISVPSTLTMDYPSVAALAVFYEAKLAGTVPAPDHAPAPEAAPRAGPDAPETRSVGDLNDDEVADALAAELEALAPELLA